MIPPIFFSIGRKTYLKNDYSCSRILERCRSGRSGRSRKPLTTFVVPGFESLSLRPHVKGRVNASFFSTTARSHTMIRIANRHPARKRRHRG